MTVQEMINKLNKIENKNLPIKYVSLSGGNIERIAVVKYLPIDQSVILGSNDICDIEGVEIE